MVRSSFKGTGLWILTFSSPFFRAGHMLVYLYFYTKFPKDTCYTIVSEKYQNFLSAENCIWILPREWMCVDITWLPSDCYIYPLSLVILGIGKVFNTQIWLFWLHWFFNHSEKTTSINSTVDWYTSLLVTLLSLLS
jgi:hypothetical protein